MGVKTWLGLKRRQFAHHTVKPWPADLARHEGPIVTFGIPLRSARTSTDWSRTQALLGATLRSVLRQSDPRWRLVICGHEVPAIPEMGDSRIEFIASTASPPPPPRPDEGGRIREDKYRKRIILGLRLFEVGGGYFMDLDADDLIHRDLVATALASENGCIITSGYICDASTNHVAPIPGVISVDFDRICGSMAVIRYDVSQLPRDPNNHIQTGPFADAHNHGYVRVRLEEAGRALAVVPFPAAVYMINTNQNISFVDTRSKKRGSKLTSLVHAHAITDPERLKAISEEFGWIRSPANAVGQLT